MSTWNYLEPLCVGQPDCGLGGVTWAASQTLSLGYKAWQWGWDLLAGETQVGEGQFGPDSGKTTQPGRTGQGSEGG